MLEPRGRTPECCHSAWGSCHDHCARTQCRAAAQVSKDGRNVVDEIVRLGGLTQLAVDKCFQVQSTRIRNDGGGYDDGTDGTKLVKGLCVGVLAATSCGGLPVPRRNVVADGVAQDIGRWVFVGSQVLAILPDHHGEFSLSGERTDMSATQHQTQTPRPLESLMRCSDPETYIVHTS